MTSWREDAQPEWPEVAAATGELPADGSVRDRKATQVRDGDDRASGCRLPAGTEILRGIPRQSEGEADSFRSSDSGTESRTAVRDPWQEDAHPVGSAHDPAGTPGSTGHTHDPHEVTIQLDAVQLGDGSVRRVEEGIGAGPAPADRPVFVDESGRRSRRFRRIGIAIALACGVYAAVIVATLLSGNSNAPWLPVPGQKQDPSAGQVDTPPLPKQSDPATGTGTGATAPVSAPTADEATSPSPAAGVVEPAATVEPGRRGPTARPSPTAARTTPDPGTGVTDPAPTEPADPPTTPAPDPTPTVEPTPEPTETLGADDSDGTGTVAEGPVETPNAEPTPAV
ncbi:hypothetical protein QNO09_27895 [Streptomyces sp. 378]|uniref:hypothetical protein n=1 Tax=Streptomyces sp. 378 TaxID=3049412 RepID=UPI0024C45DDB|nr:hypothetical protein [Streptomyces sp. 378]MDK1347057.1 hypothetical protein [Streptomyces sp. 378]